MLELDCTSKVDDEVPVLDVVLELLVLVVLVERVDVERDDVELVRVEDFVVVKDVEVVRR